jgi:hypothetical protein
MVSIESYPYHDSARGPNWLFRFGVNLDVKPRRLCRFCRVIRFITLIGQQLAFSNSTAWKRSSVRPSPPILPADPGLELRSRLLQNDSELTFVIETA